MSRRPDPSYRQHRQSGLAVVTLSDANDGRRRDFMLGEYESPASYEEYERVMARWKANGRRLPTDPVVDITIAELIVRYWQHVESYYRHPDGTPTDGHQRIITLGPKCQAIIRRYLSVETYAQLFSPRKNMEERSATLRSNRKTKVQPSQQNRRTKRPRKAPGERYTVVAYGRAIAKAIQRHNAKVSQREQIPHWHPHQLRHTRALELKRESGLDVARAVLGHRSPAITEHYATLDIAKAAEVMAKLG